MKQEKTAISPPNQGFEETKASTSLGKDFSRLISMERSLRWPTAKKFWMEKKEELGCSYNRYAVIEKGTAKASLGLARKIVQALEIQEDSGICAWVRDLMPDERSRACFPDPNSYEKISRTPLLFLEKGRARLFRDVKFAFEMAGYLSMYTKRGVCEDELCRAFKINRADVKELLNKLMRLGIVSKKSETLYEVPEEAWIQLPDLPELRPLKTRVFSVAIESHFSTSFDEAQSLELFKIRRFTPRQIDRLRIKVRAICSWLGMLPDEPGSHPYDFSAAGNLASFGRARKKFFQRAERSGRQK